MGSTYTFVMTKVMSLTYLWGNNNRNSNSNSNVREVIRCLCFLTLLLPSLCIMIPKQVPGGSPHPSFFLEYLPDVLSSSTLLSLSLTSWDGMGGKGGQWKLWNGHFSLSLSLSPFLGWDGRGGWAMEWTRFSLIPFC